MKTLLLAPLVGSAGDAMNFHRANPYGTGSRSSTNYVRKSWWFFQYWSKCNGNSRRETKTLNMKNVLVSFISVLLAMCAYAQQVQYTFSKEVDKEIDSYIEKLYSSNRDIKFYIEVSTIWIGDNKGNFEISIGDYSDNNPPSMLVASLISNSNHFYLNGETKIPIFFDYDSAFISYGTDSKGRVVRKELMLHTFTIQFNRKGQIKKRK